MQKISYLNTGNIQIPMIFEQNKLLPIISFKIVIKSCGALQNTKAGLSRIVAQMFHEGTAKLGANKFAKCLEDKAISFSVYSGYESFNFELNSLKENFQYGIKMLSKLFDDPNMTEQSLQKIKTITKGQILSKKSDFDYIAYNLLQKILYENTPLGEPMIGDEESVQSICLQDVKEFVKNINLSNAYVVIGGDLSEFEANKYALSVLSKFDVGTKQEIKSYKTNPDKILKTIIKPSEQAYIYFGSPFYVQPNSNELHKAKLAAFILGASGFGSRLMEEVRVKRGLAYSVYCKINIEFSKQEFTGYLQTKNENKQKAIEVIKELICEFVKKGVSEDELVQAKKFLLGSEPLRNESLSQRLNRAFSEVYRGFELGYSKNELKKIEDLTLCELNKFISSHDEIKKLSFAIVSNE